MQVVYFKHKAEKFSVFHVTEGLSADHIQMMNFTYSPSITDAIDRVSERFPQADVAVFPSGGTTIPVIQQ
jgi:hypothetical protein